MLYKHLQLSYLFSFFFISPFPNKLKPCCRLFTGPLFLALIFTHRATATLLPSSDCIILPAPWDASRETQNLFDSLRQFHFPVPFSCFSHIPQFFTVDGKHHFVLLKEREEDLTWEPVAARASAWWLQWVSRFCIPHPPSAMHTYTHPSCSLLTAASLNLSGEKFIML